MSESLKTLLHEQATSVAFKPPDLPFITRTGTRRIWRRRAVTTVAVMGVVVAIVVAGAAPCVPPPPCFPLSWPADHIGWRLQAQTNAYGLGTNWLDVPNSSASGQMTFPLDPSAGCVFYRLVYP